MRIRVIYGHVFCNQMFHGHCTATFISEDMFKLGQLHTYVRTYIQLVAWYCSVRLYKVVVFKYTST